MIVNVTDPLGFGLPAQFNVWGSMGVPFMLIGTLCVAEAEFNVPGAREACVSCL